MKTSRADIFRTWDLEYKRVCVELQKKELELEGYRKSEVFAKVAEHDWKRKNAELKEVAERCEELEMKLSTLLSYVTGGRFSKCSYSIDDMKHFVDDYQQTECEKCDEKLCPATGRPCSECIPGGPCAK